MSVEGGNNLGKKKASAAKRASYASRGFAHLMDIGGVHTGTWIMGVLYLQSCPTDEQVREVIEKKLLTLSRFKSKLVVNKKTAGYEEIEDEEFDWDYHFTKAHVGKKVSLQDVADFAGNIIDIGFDIKKPLWRLVLIPEMDNGQAALILCINHSITDGIAAIGILLRVVDDSPIDPTKSLAQQLKDQKARKSAAKLEEKAVNPETEEQQPTEVKESLIVEKRAKPPKLGAMGRTSSFFGGIANALKSTSGNPDPHNSLKMKTEAFSEEYTGRKHMTMTEPLSLEEVKEVKKKFHGATVNDILLALLTMTVKGFLEEIEDPVLKNKNVKLRGNFPVSMRKNDDPLLKDDNPSNNWQPAAFRLPMDYESPSDCVWKVKKTIDRMKASPQLHVQDKIGKFLMNAFPRSVSVPVLIKLTTQVTMMLSNVPGPQQMVHVSGIPVEDIGFFVVAPIGSYLGVMTYNGRVSLSVNIDVSQNQDPKVLAKHWGRSFEALKKDVDQYPGDIPSKKKQREKILNNTANTQVEKSEEVVQKEI